MTQDTDEKRIQVIQRLSEAGFNPRAVDQILLQVDAMMTGHATLAHVLVAATEVCKVCDFSSTQKHISDALECLAGEILYYENPSLNAHSSETPGTRSGIA